MDSCHASEFSDWGFLETNIIQRVIEKVKRTRHWRKDGRALRRLNTHWRSAIDDAIESVHPLPGCDYKERDLVLLRRFPNLTSLDARPFANSLGAEPVAQAVSEMTSVRQLTISRSFLMDVNRDTVAGLSHVTHVRVQSEEGDLEKRNADAEQRDLALSKLNALKLTDLSIVCGDRELEIMAPTLNALKRLTLFIDSLASAGDISFASSLEALNLGLGQDLESPKIDAENLRNIESLALKWPSSQRLLDAFPKLRHLSLHAGCDHQYELWEKHDVLSRLGSLKVVNECDLYFDFRASPEDLPETLTLYNFDIACDGLALMTNVKRLNLCKCYLSSDMSWISSLDQLEALCISESSVNSPDSDSTVGHIGNRCTVPNLRMLSVDIERMQQIMEHVESLPNLEVLGINLSSKTDSQESRAQISRFLREQGKATDLFAFGIFGTAAVETLGSLDDLSFLPKLDTLWIDMKRTTEHVAKPQPGGASSSLPSTPDTFMADRSEKCHHAVDFLDQLKSDLPDLRICQGDDMWPDFLDRLHGLEMGDSELGRFEYVL